MTTWQACGNGCRLETARRFIFSVCAISMGVASSFALAEQNEAVAPIKETANDEKMLREVEVTTIRSGASSETTSRSMSVISATNLLERPAAIGVPEVLSEVPSVQFIRTGTGGQLQIRGFSSSSTRSIITVDGDRFQGRGALEFTLFDADSIERLEVIRGAASAYYGGDAMNGVVNIVSRRSKIDPHQDVFEVKPRLRAIGVASVNNMVSARGELEGGGKGFDFLIGLTGRAGSDYDTPSGRVENTGLKTFGLDFNLGYSFPNDPHQSRLELLGRFEHITTEQGGGSGAAPGAPTVISSQDPTIENYLRLGYSGKDFGFMADSLEATLYRRVLKTDLFSISRANPAVTTWSHSLVYSPMVWGGHVTALKGAGNHLIGYGIDFINSDNDPSNREMKRFDAKTGALLSYTPWENTNRARDMTNVGAYISDEWKALDRLTLSGALRFDYITNRISNESGVGENAAILAAFGDDPRNEETAVTGNLGTVFKLTPVWDITANLSRGFRAPTTDLNSAGTSGTITTIPAPDLKPEYNWTLELGTRWHSGQHRGSLVVYQSRYTDLIASVRLDPVTSSSRNVGKVEISGLELSGEWQITKNWSARYMMAATRATDKTGNKPLAYISPLVGRLAARYEGEKWYAESVWRGYKGKTRIDKSQERKSGSYAMLDIYAGMNLDKLLGHSWRDYKVIVGVENVLDRAGRNPVVYENISYPRGIANPLVEPGRNVVLKIVSTY